MALSSLPEGHCNLNRTPRLSERETRTRTKCRRIPQSAREHGGPSRTSHPGYPRPVFQEGKIVEGIDIKDDDTLLDAIDRFGSRYRWASDLLLETSIHNGSPLLRLLKPQTRSGRLSKTNLHERTVSFNSQFATLLNLRATSKSDPPPRSPSSTEWTRLNTRCSVAKETDEFILPWAFRRVVVTI